MSGSGRRAAGLGVTVAALLFGGVGSAFASDTLQECIQEGTDLFGEPPTCTKVNGTWTPSFTDLHAPTTTGGGGSGAFAFLFVMALVVGIGVLLWKVSMAQKLAKQSGMDPSMATQMTLLTDDGLEATYLASSLRPVPAAAPPAAPLHAPPSAAERLTELASLLDQGLITQAEYDERRKAIIDAV